MNTTFKSCLTPGQSATLIAKGISADKASMCQLYSDYDGEIIDPSEVYEDCGKLLAVVDDEAIEVDRNIVSKDSDFDHSFADDTSIFTLADLVSLLPKSIEYNGYAEAKLNIYTRPHRRECWVAKYIVSAKTIPYDGAGEELIDALYEVLCKLLDNHVKLG